MATQLNASKSTTSTQRDDIERSRKPVKKDKQRPPSPLANISRKSNDGQSSTAVPYRRSSSLSLPAEFADATLKQALLEKECGSSSTKADIQLGKNRVEEESGLASLKVPQSDQGISWKWLRARKGIRTRKLTGPTGRRSTDGFHKREKCSPGEGLHTEDDMHNEIDSVGSERKGKSKRRRSKDPCHSSTSLSSKYQPKLFGDIAGHEILVKALSNAVQKEKIAPLYLFHGPSGTGKTSTARIFSMALNCESTTHMKPCWSCRGCTRSLYIMDLCSGSRVSGFERIRTLLQSTSFTQIVTGFKVFIIEECHSLTAEAWEEILNIVERGSTVVFVLITEDVTMVPKGISSRCQKFCFPKLKDMDITLKLARTVSREEIEIEREALRLITSKADGSMREAENILDQLALLGSRITSPMVQQIVGLVPHNKLLDLLMTVLSADTIKTVKSTRELIASGVQPQSILSQLASLVTDILSGAAAATGATPSAGSSKDKRLSRTGSQLTDDQSERLSHALKMLVETEKQLSSSNDQTNWVVSALLQIASEHFSSRTPSSIVLPQDIVVPSDSIKMQRSEMSELLHHSRSKRSQNAISSILEGSDIGMNDLSSLMKSISIRKGCQSRTVEREQSFRQIGNMEEVWQNILGRIETQYVKEFLSQQGKIASLTISSANAIVHLMFKRPEDKLAAQMSEETIENALTTAFGCPVTINISLQPTQIEMNEGSSTKGKETQCGYSRQLQCSTPFLPPSESPHSQNSGVVLRHNGSRKSSAGLDSARAMRLQGDVLISQGQIKRSSEKLDVTTTRPQQILPFSGPLTQGQGATSQDQPENVPSAREQDPSTTNNMKKKDTNVKHRWLSLSSIQQGDASVERYSQDLLFENENNERDRGKSRHSKLHRGFVRENNEEQYNQHSAKPMVLNRSWSCSDVLCRRETKVINRG